MVLSSDSFQNEVFEASQDVIIFFDLNYHCQYVNSRIGLICDVKPDYLIGRRLEELDFCDRILVPINQASKTLIRTKETQRFQVYAVNEKDWDWVLTAVMNDLEELKGILATGRDITDLGLNPSDSDDTQVQMKDAFYLARLSTWEIDMVHHRTLLNPEFCDIIGIPFNASTPFLESDVYFNDFVHPDDKELFREKFKEAVSSQNQQYQSVLNYRINTADGRLIWIMATIRLRFNESGQAVGAYGTFQDITNIKQTEQELEKHKTKLEELVDQRTVQLKQSEYKLQDAIDLAKLSTWEFDIATEKLSLNGVLQRKLGSNFFDKKENYIKIDRFTETIHEDDFKKFYDAARLAMITTDEKYFDIVAVRMLDSGGVMRHMNITFKVRFGTKSNAPDQLYGTIQDVTYLIDSKIEKERLTSIIEATSDIVVIVNLDHKIDYLNAAGREFFGTKNFGNASLHIGQIFGTESNGTGLGIFEKVEQEGIWIGENRILRYDNVEVPVSEVILAHKNSVDKTDCYSITFRDLSRQKQIESDLTYKNNELDTFVYRVSHDLRGPIASLLGLYNVVKHEIKDPLSLEFFEMYNNQIIRLNETIIALIDLTRIKEQETTKVPIDFNEIVHTSISSFTHLPNFEKIAFNIKIDVHRTYKSDKALIKTIVQNLIENAIKYQQEGGDPSVEINISDSGNLNNGIIIKVKDNGIGIEEEMHARIFDMFFRANSQAMGSGLGLYILKNAVDKLNGKIFLKSKLHKGTTFTIELPSS